MRIRQSLFSCLAGGSLLIGAAGYALARQGGSCCFTLWDWGDGAGETPPCAGPSIIVRETGNMATEEFGLQPEDPRERECWTCTITPGQAVASDCTISPGTGWYPLPVRLPNGNCCWISPGAGSSHMAVSGQYIVPCDVSVCPAP